MESAVSFASLLPMGFVKFMGRGRGGRCSLFFCGASIPAIYIFLVFFSPCSIGFFKILICICVGLSGGMSSVSRRTSAGDLFDPQ